MSETPLDPDSTAHDASITPGIDLDPDDAGSSNTNEDVEKKDDVDPVQEGAPATGPEAPVPPGGSDDADE